MHLRHFQAILLAIAVFTPHNFAAVSPAKKTLSLHAAIQDKNFYLLSLFQTNDEIRSALMAEKALSQINAARQQHIRQALQTSPHNPSCKLPTLVWTDAAIHTVSLA